MSEFSDPEPMFRETYTLILNCIKKNQIYVMDEDASLARVSWLKLVVYVLAAASHTGGVVDRMLQGADLVQLSSDLSATLILWQAILLYIQMYANRNLIKNLIINLGSKWRTDDQLRPEMIAVKQKSVKSFYTWISVFYKILTSFTFLYFWPRLLYVAVKHFILKQEVSFTTRYHLKVPFPHEDKFIPYSLLYLADSKILIDISYLVTYDLLLMNATMLHLRLMFVMLQDELKRIVRLNEDVNQAVAMIRMKKIIPQHKDLLQLMMEISDAFGSIFLIHLVFFSTTMCFFSFAARVHCSPENIQNLLASGFILSCIYTCCSYGQHLTDASVDIAEAAYCSQWHLVSAEYRSCILFIILRSQKVQYIKSTSFTDVSLQTFTKILNATWSFLSLLMKVYEA